MLCIIRGMTSYIQEAFSICNHAFAADKVVGVHFRQRMRLMHVHLDMMRILGERVPIA